jgi:hypothetical protein
VRLQARLHREQRVAADEPAHAHPADDEWIVRELAHLADAVDEHVGVALDLVHPLVQADDHQVVACGAQRARRALLVEDVVEVVRRMAAREALDHDQGVGEGRRAVGEVDPCGPGVPAVAAQRDRLVGHRSRRLRAQRQGERGTQRLGAVGAAQRRLDRGEIGIRDGHRRAECHRAEPAAVARVELDRIGQRRADVEPLGNEERDGAAAVGGLREPPLVMQERAREERLVRGGVVRHVVLEVCDADR